MNGMDKLQALFGAMPYFIVTRSNAVAGTGETVTAYLKFPGEWTEDRTEALRYPQKVLAESYARRFHGVVEEVSGYPLSCPKCGRPVKEF
jgi:hypothetical protein